MTRDSTHESQRKGLWSLGVFFCAFLWVNTSVHSWWWWYLQKAVQCTIPATSNTVCLLSVGIKQEAGECAQANPWWVNQWMNPLIDYSLCSIVSRLVSGWHYDLVRIQNTVSGKRFSSSFWIPVNARYYMFDQYSFLLPTQICHSGSSEWLLWPVFEYLLPPLRLSFPICKSV